MVLGCAISGLKHLQKPGTLLFVCLGFFCLYWTQFYCSKGRHGTYRERERKYDSNVRSTKKLCCYSLQTLDAHIVPTLLHAAKIWGYQKYEHIERVCPLSCKIFAHVHNKTPNDVVDGDLDHYIYTLLPATARFVKFWLKLLGQTDNVYSKKSHKMLLEMMRKKSTITWESHVKSVLNHNRFEPG